MKYIPLDREEIAQLLQQAKSSLEQPRSARYGHPTIGVQVRLEKGIQDESQRERMRQVYLAWQRRGCPGDITDQINTIVNG